MKVRIIDGFDCEKVLNEFEQYVLKKLPANHYDRDEVVCEIIYQAFLELRRIQKPPTDEHVIIKDPLPYLRLCYSNFYLRAISEIRSMGIFCGESDSENTVASEFSDFMAISNDFWHIIQQKLTPRQLEVVTMLLISDAKTRKDAMKLLGYSDTSEPAFYQMLKRIRKKIGEVFDE